MGKKLFEVYFDFFSLAHIQSANMEGGGVYELYCSQPPGGDPDVFASVIQSMHQPLGPTGKLHLNLALNKKYESIKHALYINEMYTL